MKNRFVSKRFETEFNYRIHLLHKAMNKHLLCKIPKRFIHKLDIDELGSVLLGLLSSKGKEKKDRRNKMSKVKYNKKTKQYERTIKINGLSTLVSFPKREYLEQLPYRLNNKNNEGDKLKC